MQEDEQEAMQEVVLDEVDSGPSDESLKFSDTEKMADSNREAANAVPVFTTLKIVIKGLALCREAAAPARLQVLFPHPSDHNLKFTLRRGSDVIDTRLARQNFIKIVSTGAEPAIPAGSDPSTKDNIIDIVNLHRTVNPIAGVKMKNKRGQVGGPVPSDQVKLSFVSIPSVDLYVPDFKPLATAHKFYVHVPSSNTRTYISGKDLNVATSVGLALAMDTLGEKIEIQLSTPFPTTYTIPYDPTGPTYTLILDNACENGGCGADFGYYYEILDGFGLEIEEFPPRPPIVGGTGSDTQAACNPVKGDPGCDLETYFGLPPGTGCQ